MQNKINCQTHYSEEMTLELLYQVYDEVYKGGEFIINGVDISKIALNSGLGRRVKFDGSDYVDIQKVLSKSLSAGNKRNLYNDSNETLKNIKKSCLRLANQFFETASQKLIVENEVKFKKQYKFIKEVDIVFVAFYENYLNSLLPVIGECIKKGLTTSLIIPSKDVKWKKLHLLNKNCELVYFSDIILVSNNEDESVNVAIKSASNNLSHLAANGSNLSKMLTKREWHDFERYISDSIPMHINYCRKANEILGKLKPKVLFVARMNRPSECAFVYTAKNLKIKTCMVPHSLFPINTQGILSKGHLDTDIFFSWGEMMNKNYLVNARLNKVCDVVDVGYVNTDLKNSDNNLKENYNKQELGILIDAPKQNPWIVVFLGRNTDSLVAGLIDNKMAINKYGTIIFKEHPNRKLNFITRMKIKRSGMILITNCRNLSAENLIECADIVVGYSSTALQEACVMRRPVLSGLLSDRKINSNAERNFNLGMLDLPFFENIDEFIFFVHKLLCNDSYKNVLIERQFSKIKYLMCNINASDAKVNIVNKITSLS